MSNSQKTSQFTQLTTLDDSALITITSNGQNFTLPFSALKTDLGVSGTLESIGDPLGVPVLNEPSAQDYQIRNLESGAGVIASVSANNGINLAWNVTQDATGFPLTDGLTDKKPTISSLVEGVGIEISKTNGSLTISATGELGIIVIKEEADYPNQDGSNVFLDEGTLYFVANSYTHTKPFICADGSAITALNQLGVVITYAGSTDLFTGVDVNFKIFEIGLDTPNAQYFNFKDVAVANTNIFWCSNVIGNRCAKFGTIDSMASLVITDTAVTGDCTDGLTILGSTWRVWRIQNSGFITSSASFVGIDLGTATASAVGFGPVTFVGTGAPGAIGFSGLANSGNILTGNIARIENTNYLGNVTPLSGLDSDDIRWEFLGNSIIPDTRADGLASIITNATETVIASSSIDGTNAVKMAGTWTIEGSSHFTADTTGRITYNGERPFTGPIDVTVNVLMASGSTKNVSAYLDISGTIERATEGKATPTSSLGDSCICHWQHTFTTNDYAEVWLENQSDAVNIIGQSGVLRVN